MGRLGEIEGATSNREGIGGERTVAGRFAPGNRASVGHGRPPRARELEVFEAAARGAPAVELEKLMAKMIQLGLEGDVSAARLVCQVRGLIGRDEPTPQAEQGESMAGILALPGKAEEISRLMDAIYSTPMVAESTTSRALETPRS